ncbi:MAG: Long-chain-fatty-acid--CoA ligase FadD13 [Deltaproteobacteria bacterium]|jgi:acyl-CoA synthetase (AMP-forming)/AMP-acid ligase II|nr:Long-chain-fatty-acid--CoA ligase FadD13 [Deltaproteobacteria bacterium]
MNIGSLLPRHARYRPEHLAFVIGEQRLNFHELNSRVNCLANALLKAGIRKGQKMATVLSNCEELMLLYWAAAKTGIVIVPSSPLLQASGLTTLLRDSDTVIVFAEDSFTSIMEQIREDLPNVEKERWILVGEGIEGSGYQMWTDFISDASDEEPPDAELKDDDVYNIMYSSGTTGAPKGIVHTHYVRANYCIQFASAWRMTPESVVLHSGAIVFNGAMLDLMPWMYLGATYILHQTFDAGAVLQTIEQEKVTHIVMVPSQIVALLNHPEFDPKKLKSLEMLQSVGAPLLLEYKHKLNDVLPGIFYELYGVTEGFFSVLDRDDAVSKVGSVGAAPAFIDIRILRENGEDCDPDEVGEICGRGPMMMPGYYNRPDLTEKTIVNGWLHSGDLGYLDTDGYLYLVDRVKDMIISGGVNVYPKDIEEIIIKHPEVIEVAVFGVPDKKWGETPVAAVICLKNHNVSAEKLTAWTNERVDAKFQRVKEILILESFPLNVAGKTLKREMRDAYINS